MGRWIWAILGVASVAAAEPATLRLHNDQYIRSGTEYFRDSANGSDTSLSLKVQQDWSWRKRLKASADLKNEYSAAEKWNYLNVYQARVSTRLASGVVLDLGRKRETWSAFDEEWKQGVFEPRYLQNKLRPESAGLTGLFISGPIRSWWFSLALLPVHVPDFGARFSVENYHLVSKNPWFVPPAESYKVRAPSEIRYEVEKPSISDVVSHPGIAAKVEHSGANAGFRFAAAFKPIAQFRLGFPSENRVVVSSQEDYLDIRITPAVIYHGVVSADSWFKAGAWDVLVSGVVDHPATDKLPKAYTAQTFSTAYIGSVSAARALGVDGSEALRFKLGILKIWNGLGPDRGEFGRDPSLFEGRFQYSEAYWTGLAWPIRGVFKSPLMTEARVVFDRLQNGGTIGLRAGYAFNRDWRLDADMDVLGLLPGTAIESGRFFSTYRANDRVGLGMSYVF